MQPKTAALHDVEQGELTQQWALITPNLCVFCLWCPMPAGHWCGIAFQVNPSSKCSPQALVHHKASPVLFSPFQCIWDFSESSSHLRCYTLIQITPSQSPSTTAFTRNSAKVHNGWGILNPFQGRFNSSSQEDSDSCCSLSPALTPTQLPLLLEHQPTLTYPLQPTGHHMSHSPCIWGLGLAGVLAQPSRRPFMHKDQQISKAG